MNATSAHTAPVLCVALREPSKEPLQADATASHQAHVGSFREHVLRENFSGASHRPSRLRGHMSYQLGIDVGGTFTDFVAANSASQFKGKVPTRPGDEATSVLEAVAAVATHFGSDVGSLLAETEQIVLGTTVVTNTMLEYNGVKTGLITTEGFRDLIELRRGYKESLVDLALPAPVPIVPRRLRKGVTERIDSDGIVVEPLDEDSVRLAVRELRDAGVESIAVCLLFSFKNRHPRAPGGRDHRRGSPRLFREPVV